MIHTGEIDSFHACIILIDYSSVFYIMPSQKTFVELKDEEK
jgi:hypothetical protein